MTSFIGFIPTPEDQIKAFFELVELSESDVVYDLGSGDGRLLFAALEKGAGKGIGVETNTECIRKARESAKRKGLQDRITFLEADVMDTTLNDASVIFCYLSFRASIALKPKLESELKSGARVVTEFFPIPGWKPVKTVDRERKRFYLYRMPPEICEENTVDPLLEYLAYP